MLDIKENKFGATTVSKYDYTVNPVGAGAMASAGFGGTTTWDNDGDIEGPYTNIGFGGGAGAGAGATGSFDGNTESGSTSLSPIGPTVGGAAYYRFNFGCTKCSNGTYFGTLKATYQAFECLRSNMKSLLGKAISP